MTRDRGQKTARQRRKDTLTLRWVQWQLVNTTHHNRILHVDGSGVTWPLHLMRYSASVCVELNDQQPLSHRYSRGSWQNRIRSFSIFAHSRCVSTYSQIFKNIFDIHRNYSVSEGELFYKMTEVWKNGWRASHWMNERVFNSFIFC